VNRLSVRLAAAIILTTLVAVGLVAIAVNRAAGSEFRRYLSGSDTAAGADLAPALVTYYEQAGSWAGIETFLAAEATTPGLGRGGRGRGAVAGQGRGPALLLADAEGRVIYDSQGQMQDDQLSRADLALALPITSSRGAVGYLLVLHGTGSQLAAPEQAFLDRVNRALLLAAGLAILLGIGLSALLARTLTAPLRRVSAGAQAIAAGDLSQRVPEQGTVETQAVARSFNHMAADLEQAEQQRRNLMADVAHELRTPLTVIQGNLQALLDGVYPLERAEIATIYDETRLLSRLVADLRELALAEAGQLKLELRPSDASAIVRQTVDSFAPLAEAKHITLVVTAEAVSGAAKAATTEEDEDLWAMADPDRLSQVLRNLVSNALRHTPEGGRVEVSVSRARSQTGSGAETVSALHAILITVADTGPGIPADELPHVFDRFWSRSRDAGSPGSGLGLAIAKSLVETQGGQIGVDSQSGHGAHFWFTLPMTQAPSIVS
jgi:two-component system OmpR family sensor kinase/two-component system sensor histidine kinase BaeS